MANASGGRDQVVRAIVAASEQLQLAYRGAQELGDIDMAKRLRELAEVLAMLLAFAARSSARAEIVS